MLWRYWLGFYMLGSELRGFLKGGSREAGSLSPALALRGAAHRQQLKYLMQTQVQAWQLQMCDFFPLFFAMLM